MKNRTLNVSLLFVLFNLCFTNLPHANISKDIGYLLPYFVKGKVYFKNGTVTDARLNYSYQDGQLQFIGANQDTMLLTNKWFIRQVVIGNYTFYCSEQYGDLQQVSDFHGVKLLSKKYFRPVENTKDYSERNYTAPADKPSTHYISSTTGEFSWQNNVSIPGYKASTTFFILDKNNQILPAERKVILKIFTDKKEAVRQYIANKKVRFDNEDDLLKLLNYCLNMNSTEF